MLTLIIIIMLIYTIGCSIFQHKLYPTVFDWRNLNNRIMLALFFSVFMIIMSFTFGLFAGEKTYSYDVYSVNEHGFLVSTYYDEKTIQFSAEDGVYHLKLDKEIKLFVDENYEDSVFVTEHVHYHGSNAFFPYHLLFGRGLILDVNKSIHLTPDFKFSDNLMTYATYITKR